MSRPKFLADHDFKDAILQGIILREPLAEMVRCREVGLDRASDDEILQYAVEHGFIVLSHDVNTMSAAAYARFSRGENIAGLLFAIQERPIGPFIDILVLI